ncbi:phage tail protein, partial [Eikenella sp. NML080894]|uniref:tail fiber protein n=1 Tax=Eikenella sp. NML080894 TaxID=1795830 RepID=UPI000ABB6B5A
MPQPKLLSKPWAADGLKNSIPVTRNGSLAQEAATYAEGFPNITMTPISVGGKPPSGKDMNGILHEISAHTVWQNQGGRYRFDQAFCDAIGGYPKGAVLINDASDTEYISLVDANTHNPNSGNNTGKWAVHAGKGLKASTTQAGIVQLSSATNSDREDMAATSKAVKTAYDKAEEAVRKSLPLGSIVAFPRVVTNPVGFLKADGSTFAQATYPDLYRVLGGNKLPNLTRSDIGMTAYFPFGDIPDG